MSGDDWAASSFVVLLGAHLTRVWREMRRERKIAAAKRQAEEHHESLAWFDEALSAPVTITYPEAIFGMFYDRAGDTPDRSVETRVFLVPNDTRRVIDPRHGSIYVGPKNG